jgi:uncharacterized membrane protein YkoI
MVLMVALHPLLSMFVLVLVGLSPMRALADDQDRARAAVAAGKILPLAAIVDDARARFGGEVLDAEFEDEDDEDRGDAPPPSTGIYEIKLLAPGGRILKLEYDATTGELLHVRGRAEHHGREGER